MLRFAIALAAFVLAGPAAAQNIFPALYDVRGVASDDVLNLRSGPGASNEIVGALAPNQTGIEIVGTSADGSWGLVALPEGTGWASLGYLARQPGQTDYPILANLPVYCGGTEPFWNVDFADEGYLTYSRMGGPSVAIDLNNYASPVNDLRVSSFEGTGENGPVFGVLRRAQCSDGMSDRLYGIQIEFFPQILGGIQHLSGCCRLN